MPIRSRSSLTVVVPVYNEADSLEAFLAELIPFCRKNGWRLILVNDGSTDGSRAILDAQRSETFVEVIHHKVNRGYGGALKSGLARAETSHVVTIDGDGQHSPADIQVLFQFALETDADLVVGNRGAWKSANRYRELGKRLIRAFTRLLLPLPIHDLNSGFKLYRTDLVQAYLPLCPNTMAFSDVITLVFINQRNLVLEHPITVRERRAGKSTINTSTAIDTLIEIINIAMLFNPIRIFLPLALVFIAFGVLWGTPFFLMGRGISVGSMLAIVTGLLSLFIGLIAGQLSAIRMSLLHRRDKDFDSHADE